MADDKVTNWVELQKRVWDSDEGLRAQVITLETSSGDVIGSWPVDIDNLGSVINQNIDLQSAELPKGQHRFKLIAWGDKSRKQQMSELPQTIRGRSGDASQALSDSIALQRATAMAISNLENTLNITLALNDRLQKQLDERTEDFSEIYSRHLELQSDKFDEKIRWDDHQAKIRRNEQMLEMLTPVIGMAVQKFAPMILKMDAGAVAKFFEDPFPKPADAAPAAPAVPPPPAEPEVIAPPPQGNNNAGPTSQPASPASPALPEPGQTSVSPGTEGRSEGDVKRFSPQRSRKADRPSKKGSKRR
jgi:hypothetical protein